MTERLGTTLMLGLLALMAACSGSTVTTSPGSFAIYTLQDTTMSVAEAAARDLSGLALADAPFVTANDILEYSWSRQSWSITADLRARLEELARKPYQSAGIPFVVVVGEERVYLGAFWYWYSSTVPSVPHIMLPLVGPVELKGPSLGGAVDRRIDPRVRDSLRAAGVLGP
jgi:hypothetical protein